VDKHLEIFQCEANELLVEIEEVILIVEQTPNDLDAINRLFRAVHTLKGSGGMFGLSDLVELAHELEAVLDCVRSGQLPINEELIDIILSCRDLLQELIANIGHESSDDLKDRIKQAILPLKIYLGKGDGGAVDKGGVGKADGSCAQRGGTMTVYRVTFYPSDTLFLSGMDPSLLLTELRQMGECKETLYTDRLPPLSELDPRKCHMGWSVVLETDKGKDAIRDVFMFVEDGSQIEITPVVSDADVLDIPPPRLGDILVDRGDIAREQVEELATPKIGQRLVESNQVSAERIASSLDEQTAIARRQDALKRESIRVPSDKLDMLINLVGELVTNQARINQVANELNVPDLSAPVEDINRLTAELRDLVLNVRMVQIGTLFGKYKRLARDLSRDLGKEVELVTEGEDTELDKTVIDKLGEQLVHIIRNAVDHGIEAPEDREKKGKDRAGTILLQASHRGAFVVIKVRDDGKGLNTEAIKAQAMRRGIIDAEAQLTQKEIFRLIFAPGLSTASKVTDVSGRGVGMDSVLKGVEALRGTIDISSEPNCGTVIELSLPLTLAIIDGLLVEVDRERFVIPLGVVEGCLELTGSSYIVGEKRNLIQVRGGTIPLVRLRKLFAAQEPKAVREEAVVVGIGDASVAIVVDHIIGNHQTVIKSLGEMGRCSQCVSGATIMGDGRVALILDAGELIKVGCAEEKSIVSSRAA
jgi:two-component system chemotaxis sensor kinase CheA